MVRGNERATTVSAAGQRRDSGVARERTPVVDK
jgi:hypothetical protein